MPPLPADRRVRLLRCLGLLTFYLLLAAWLCRSILPAFTTRYLGGGELMGWLWRYWWMKLLVADVWHQPVRDWGYLCYTLLVCGSYPETGNVFDLQVLSWPLEHLLGDPAYYNAKCILVLAADGTAGYWLGAQLFERRAAALLVGVVCAANPYVMREIADGRIRQAILFPLALACGFMWRLRSRPRWQDALLAGACFALTTAFYLFYGMFLAFFAVLLVGYVLLRPDAERRTALLAFCLAGLVGLSLSVPFAWSYADRAMRGEPLGEVSWGREFPALADLLQPPPLVPGSQYDPLPHSLQRFRADTPSWEYLLGIPGRRTMPLAYGLLAVAGLCWPGRRPWFWAAVLLLFYVLSLGPYLRAGPDEAYVNAAGGGIPLPYLWFFRYVPFFSRLFSPARLQGMVVIGLAVLAGSGLGRWRHPEWVAAGAVVLACLQGPPPPPVQAFPVPEFYHRLAGDPSTQGLIELPLRAGDFVNFYQVVHGKRILLGWNDGALPPGFPDGPARKLAQNYQLGNNPFFQYVDRLAAGRDPQPYQDADLEMFTRLGYNYLVIHEKGFRALEPDSGAALYARVRHDLESRLGAPVAVEREGSAESPPGFEMAAFRLSRE